MLYKKVLNTSTKLYAKEMSQHKIRIHSQYIKDLSFESPNLPFLSLKKAPIINAIININSVKINGNENKIDDKNEIKSFYEITLHIEVKAMIKGDNVKDYIAFICETKYCGIFSIENYAEISQEEIKQALFITCPTFLFPFVREIIARTTSSGGFPPLMLDPVDFESMYAKQKLIKKTTNK